MTINAIIDPTPEAITDFDGTPRPTRYLHAMLLRLDLGIALLDEDANAVAVDNALSALLETGDRLILRDGRIQAICAIENMKLQATILAASRSSEDPSVAQSLTVWGESDHALIISACPIDDCTEADPRRPVMLLAVDTAPSVGLDDRFLRDAFDLTEAEALVAKRLVGGDTLSDIAEVKGISLNTARTQLKAAMLKLGVNRQSELVNLLARCDKIRRTARRADGGSHRQRIAPRFQF